VGRNKGAATQDHVLLRHAEAAGQVQRHAHAIVAAGAVRHRKCDVCVEGAGAGYAWLVDDGPRADVNVVRGAGESAQVVGPRNGAKVLAIQESRGSSAEGGGLEEGAAAPAEFGCWLGIRLRGVPGEALRWYCVVGRQ